VRYFSQINQGKSVALNQGIGQMRGEYFTFLDADDRLPPQSLARRVEALSSSPGTEVAIGGFEVIDETGKTPIGERSAPKLQNPKDLKRAFCLSYKTPFHLNACLLRRSLVERVGLFDHKLKRCQDIDYSIRCMEEVQSITWVNGLVYQYRKHRDSIRDRIMTRIATIQHRPRVVLKNFSSPQKYLFTTSAFLFDISKIIYEIFGNYNK
jgi:glycosyltransferase involved in cell wall biosynthesis